MPLPRPAPNSIKHVFSCTRSVCAKCPSKDAVCNKCLLASGPYIGLLNSFSRTSCFKISSGIAGNLSEQSKAVVRKSQSKIILINIYLTIRSFYFINNSINYTLI